MRIWLFALSIACATALAAPVVDASRIESWIQLTRRSVKGVHHEATHREIVNVPG